MAEQEGKTIHSVAKAIRLLDLLTAAGQPASLTELYQKTGWPKSTIHGLLSTMRESGLIEQTPNGRYWLGIRLFEYGWRRLQLVGHRRHRPAAHAEHLRRARRERLPVGL